MSTELKRAAQDAAEAIDWLLKNIRLDAPQLSGKAMGNAEKCASALRAALAQQPATAIACGIPGMAKTTCPYCDQEFAFEHEQPAAPQPAHATQAEVTDAAIDAATRHIYHNGRPTSKEYRVGIARAILALRPLQVPMTDEQIRSMCKQGWVFETVKQWVHVIEAHHGITTQTKKEKP